MNASLAGPTAATCCSPNAGLRSDFDANAVADVAAALASPVRVQILDVLIRSDIEVCQCELLALFDIGQSSLSHHLGRLAAAGLVQVRATAPLGVVFRRPDPACGTHRMER